MAWRPHELLIEGVLDNTTPGRVVGTMKFAGLKKPVRFRLKGDFHRDIRGTKIELRGNGNDEDPAEAQARMSQFGLSQTGNVGDITAGLPPQDYTTYPYIEWYSNQNGRVVLELDNDQVKVIGQRLDPATQEPISAEEQGRNMKNFVRTLLGG